MKTKRSFQEGIDRLYERHAKVVEEIEAMVALAEKLKDAARRDESIEALNHCLDGLSAVQGHLDAVQNRMGDV
jgi:hypothetical protein